MKKYKGFNNLYDSFCMTFLVVTLITIFSVSIYFSVIRPKEGTNPIAALIALCVIFGVSIIILIILIVKFCFEYWIIDDNNIMLKKLFIKKIIERNNIISIEKKVIPALIIGAYKSEAYVITDKNNKKIHILINKKNCSILEHIFID